MLAVCNLCLDGSTATKPDYFIGFKDPFVLNTCKDLSDAMLFIGEDSVECQNGRLWGALCGCPVAANACSICEGSQNITRPQQVLDSTDPFFQRMALRSLAPFNRMVLISVDLTYELS
jgi:hypothetical protein